MLTSEHLKKRLEEAFQEKQAVVLGEVITEAILESQKQLVKASDFNELKEIVRDLAVKTGELAEAQKRSEQRIEELAEAQRRTEEEIRRLTGEVQDIRSELGGLARSMGYAFENEAYRALPGYLKTLGIEVTERFVRREIDGEEINILGKGKKNGQEIIIVGEVEVRLTSAKKIKQLERKASIVHRKHPQKELFKILVTHFASPSVIEKAEEKGITIVQSFEWP